MTIPPELEGEYIIRIVDMPLSTPGLVMYDDDDFANIYINAHYNHESNKITANHELTHVICDDIHNHDDICTVEARADGNTASLKSVPHLMKASDLLSPPPPEAEVQTAPHQLAVLRRCTSDLDTLIYGDTYDC